MVDGTSRSSENTVLLLNRRWSDRLFFPRAQEGLDLPCPARLCRRVGKGKERRGETSRAGGTLGWPTTLCRSLRDFRRAEVNMNCRLEQLANTSSSTAQIDALCATRETRPKGSRKQGWVDFHHSHNVR